MIGLMWSTRCPHSSTCVISVLNSRALSIRYAYLLTILAIFLSPRELLNAIFLISFHFSEDPPPLFSPEQFSLRQRPPPIKTPGNAYLKSPAQYKPNNISRNNTRQQIV